MKFSLLFGEPCRLEEKDESKVDALFPNKGRNSGRAVGGAAKMTW